MLYTNYTCMQFSRYNLFILTDILSVIRNLKPCLKSLITGKTSYHNSTSLLIGLTPAHRSSPSTVLFPTELTCQRLFLYEQAPSLFFSLIRRPPALPHRLQCSTIGRLRLNRRVRDGNGCFPQAHRHRKYSRYSSKCTWMGKGCWKLASLRTFSFMYKRRSRDWGALLRSALTYHLHLITQQ